MVVMAAGCLAVAGCAALQGLTGGAENQDAVQAYVISQVEARLEEEGLGGQFSREELQSIYDQLARDAVLSNIVDQVMDKAAVSNRVVDIINDHLYRVVGG